MELEKGRPDVVVVPGFGGFGMPLAGVEVLLRALKGLLELRAPTPGVVAVEVEPGPMEREGDATADDEDSRAMDWLVSCMIKDQV